MHTKSYILALAASTALTACQKDGWGPDWGPSMKAHYLSIKNTQLTFGANSNLSVTDTISVAGTTPWQFSGMPAWLSVSSSSGTTAATVSFTATEHTSVDQGRSAIFLFACTDADYAYQCNITATQDAATPSIEVDKSVLTFAASAGQQTVNITSNFDWTATANASWLTLTPSTDKRSLSVAVSENLSTASTNTATISFSFNGTTYATISVMQKPAGTPATDYASLAFENTGGVYQLAITSEVSWTATTSASWLQLTPIEGSAGKSTLTIEAAPNYSQNERADYVYINIGGKQSLSVKITQEGVFFNITPTTQPTFTSRGGTHSLNIATNEANWTAASSDSWLTLSKQSGTGSIDVVLTAADNPSIHEREATATFTPNLLQPVKFVAKQAGRYLRADATSLQFFSKGGTSEVITITTDADYTITSSAPEWLTVQQSGNTFTVTAAKNKTDADRQATVTIAMTGLKEGETFSLPLSVVQKQPTPVVNVQPFGGDEQWE